MGFLDDCLSVVEGSLRDSYRTISGSLGDFRVILSRLFRGFQRDRFGTFWGIHWSFTEASSSTLFRQMVGQSLQFLGYFLRVLKDLSSDAFQFFRAKFKDHQQK